MSEADGDLPIDALGQDDLGTLEAELREALQHQRAAIARVQETQAQVETLMRRARELLNRGEESGRPGSSEG